MISALMGKSRPTHAVSLFIASFLTEEFLLSICQILKVCSNQTHLCSEELHNLAIECRHSGGVASISVHTCSFQIKSKQHGEI